MSGSFTRWFRPRKKSASGQEATREDILACFRLLLGREPNQEEVVGHMAQAGRQLEQVVAGYLNSLEFAKRNLVRSEEGTPSLAQLDGFSMYAQADDEAVGRHVLQGAYEPEVEAVFRKVLRPGMGVVDAGANIGYFTMVSAGLVGDTGYVLAIEPNPDNARLLEASRRLNGFGHVSVAQVAAGRQTGLLALNATHSNGTTSTVSAELDALLRARTVPSVPIDVLVESGRRIDLIKVDVEGAEYNVLLGAARVIARDRPTIVTEFSPALMPGISGIDGPGYLAWLHGQGYSVAVIHRDGSLEPTGQDAGAVMSAYARSGVDHIDLMATVPGLP